MKWLVTKDELDWIFMQRIFSLPTNTTTWLCTCGH